MDARVAVVTGGANGIGKELVRKYLANDYNVAAFDINGEALKCTAEQFARPDNFLPLVTDVLDEASVTTSVRQVVDRFGHTDILVNNTGGSIGLTHEVEKLTVQDWDKVIQFNLRGTFLCTKAVIPIMKRRKWGRIINLSSAAGRSRSFGGSAAYAAAKAGVIGFTRQSSRELGKYGITVNVVAPGLVLTERARDYWNNVKTEEERNAHLSITPLGRMGLPEDVAEVLYFLSTDGAAYITGAVIDVNGGQWVG